MSDQQFQEKLLKKQYRFDTLIEAWKDYTTRKVLRVLRDGKWHVQPFKAGVKIEGTSAMVVTIDKVMGFPRFLSKYYG